MKPSLSYLPLKNKGESMEKESSISATDIQSFRSLKYLLAEDRDLRFIPSVCQSIATTVLDPQQHSAQQLWTKLWERLDDGPMK